MRKKVNYLKVASLLFLILDSAIIGWVNAGFQKAELITWLAYEGIVMMIPINVMIILGGKDAKVKQAVIHNS